MLFGKLYMALEKHNMIFDMKREDGIVTITVLDKPPHIFAKEYIFVLGELVLIRIRGLLSNQIVKMIPPRKLNVIKLEGENILL